MGVDGSEWNPLRASQVRGDRRVRSSPGGGSKFIRYRLKNLTAARLDPSFPEELCLRRERQSTDGQAVCRESRLKLALTALDNRGLAVHGARESRRRETLVIRRTQPRS